MNVPFYCDSHGPLITTGRQSTSSALCSGMAEYYITAHNTAHTISFAYKQTTANKVNTIHKPQTIIQVEPGILTHQKSCLVSHLIHKEQTYVKANNTIYRRLRLHSWKWKAGLHFEENY